MKYQLETGVVLYPGDKHPIVISIREYLARFGYWVGAAKATSDEFDSALSTSLKRFQKKMGLEPTGYFDYATAFIMSKPRCGVPDIGSFAEGTAGGRWNKRYLTYAIENASEELSMTEVADFVQQAFALWEGATPLRFEKVDLSKNHDIKIVFGRGEHGDDIPFDFQGGVLAHAFYPSPYGGPFAGDAHFDDAEIWTIQVPTDPGKIDFFTVAAHEFGHSIGLGHLDDPGSLMYPYYSGPHRYLANADASAARDMYAAFGQLQFYEGNNATQNLVDFTDDRPGQNFRPKQNDETRSMRLVNVRKGCVISVFDHPKAKTSDDYTVIRTKQFIDMYVLGTYEQSYEDAFVAVSHKHKNGLDGKVSRIKVD